MVCGLFFRLRRKGRVGGGGGRGRGLGVGVKRGFDLVELRGAERSSQISRDLDAVCAEEGGWSNDWAFAHVAGAQNYNPVPYWSWRPICPWEWREGTGVSVEEGRVEERSHRVRAGVSYGERMRTLAEAAGTFGTLLNLGWGRFIGPRPCLPGRVEDTSGVT